jgi:CHAT domain-containing protein/Tfp pilus assembly protein PilF
LSISIKGEELTGELQDRQLGPTDQGCNYHATLRLKKIEKDAGFRELSVCYDAATVESQGLYYQKIARYADAEPLLKKALDMSEKAIGDCFDTAAGMNNLADLYWLTGRYSEAESLYKRALEMWKVKFGEGHPKIARCLASIANILALMGRNEEAESLYKQALDINMSRLGKNCPEVAIDLNNLAVVYMNLGRNAEAEKLFRQSLAIFESTLGRDHPEAANTCGHIADICMRTGRYDEAESLYKRAIQIYQLKLGKDHPKSAQSMNRLGVYYDSMGRYAEAEQLIRQAIEIQKTKLGDNHLALASSLDNLAHIYRSTRRYAMAEPLYRQALQIKEANLGKDHPSVAMILNRLGTNQTKMGRYAEAEQFFLRAIEIQDAKLSRNHPDKAWSLNNLGCLYDRMGRFSEAATLFTRALIIPDVNSMPALLRLLQSNYSRILVGLGNRDAAIFFGKRAVNTAQEQRQSVSKIDKETLESFQETVGYVYKQLANLLIDVGRLPEAQQVMELLKQEEYFEYVRQDTKKEDSVSGSATFTGLEGPLDVRYRRAVDESAALGVERAALDRKAQSQKLTANEETRLIELDQDLEMASRAFEKVIADIGNELSEKRQDKMEQIKEAQGLQEDLRELGEGVVALYTIVGENSFRLLLITPEFRKAYEYQITEKDLNRKVNEFRKALRGPQHDPLSPAREMYSIIVGPAAQDLKELRATTLMWSLDGALRYLPVAALHDGEHYLVENYRSVIFTPASQARLKDRPKTNWSGLGLGVSKEHEGFAPMPAVPVELSGIIRTQGATGGVLPGVIDIDDAFTFEAMKEGLRKRYPLVHIASHFKFTPGDDTKSYLVLGDGSHLPLSEVRLQNNLFGGVELLTLSACNTGVGDGREVEGFGVLAQRQGAKGVIATLWPVADESTGIFMQNFYQLREQEKLTKAEALQKAQLIFIRGQASQTLPIRRGMETELQGSENSPSAPQSAPYSHPYFWAPFILMGNWL